MGLTRENSVGRHRLRIIEVGNAKTLARGYTALADPEGHAGGAVLGHFRLDQTREVIQRERVTVGLVSSSGTGTGACCACGRRRGLQVVEHQPDALLAAGARHVMTRVTDPGVTPRALLLPVCVSPGPGAAVTARARQLQQ